MATYSKENYISLKFFRDEGYRLSSTWFDYAKELPDKGAEVNFSYTFSRGDEELLNVNFGYTSPSGKEYKRDLDLSIHQVIQLRDYLNHCLNTRVMEGKYFYFFSYGSNMLYERIKERVETVEFICKYELKGYRLLFNKRSKDGSRKANIQKTSVDNDSVWGVIQKIALADKPKLDKYEGLGNGYVYMNFNEWVDDEYRTIHSYIALETEYLNEGAPYEWYLKFIMAGAIQNSFPSEYIAQLKRIDSISDMNEKRRVNNERILKAANIEL